MKKLLCLCVLTLSLFLGACHRLSSNQESSKTDNSTSLVTADQAIGLEKAKELAFSEAGVTSDEVTNFNLEEGLEDGRQVYELDFSAKGKRYDFTLDQKTGAILEASSEVAEMLVATEVTEVAAREIALTDADVKEADVSHIKVSQDKENGQLVYEVNFAYDGKEYDYTIDAESGRIITKEVEQAD